MSNKYKGKIKWDEKSALVFLKRRNLMIESKKISFGRFTRTGLTVLGCLDFLKNHCGYWVIY